MNILITGGTGLIGSFLTKKLLLENHNVSVITRNIDKAKELLYEKTNLIEGDVSVGGNWQELVNNFDVIINLAGEPISLSRWSKDKKRKLYQSRILSTKNLVSSISQNTKVKLFINASAVGYYGIQKDDRNIYESEISGRDFLAQLCKDWEQEAEKINLKNKNIRLVILRIGIVLSDRGGAIYKLKKIFNSYIGGNIGFGNNWFPWIHIDDLIDIILFVINNKKISGAINCTSPNPERFRDFVKYASKTLNRPKFIYIPSILPKLVLGESSNLILGGQKAIPRKLLDNNFKFEFEKLELALNNILGN
ncbi:MAG: epimerase [Candidatus Sericytochromatia bacterium]|nr:MAG: epimerase [Candidatus Sericytochromatia bacterium]